MKKMEDMNEENIVNINENESEVVAVKKPGFVRRAFNHVKDNWVPYLVGTVLVAAGTVVVAYVLGQDPDGTVSDIVDGSQDLNGDAEDVIVEAVVTE